MMNVQYTTWVSFLYVYQRVTPNPKSIAFVGSNTLPRYSDEQRPGPELLGWNVGPGFINAEAVSVPVILARWEKDDFHGNIYRMVPPSYKFIYKPIYIYMISSII